MPTLLRMSAGAFVWAAHFAALYGLTAFACARAAAGAVPWIVGLATLAGMVAAGAIVVRAYPRRDDFAHWMTAAVAGVAIVAMFAEAVAGLVARSCG